MFNAILATEILEVKPYADDEKGNGIIIVGKVETTERSIFNDINFNGKEAGVSYILSGDVPLKGKKIPLAFIKPELELQFGSFKHLPISLEEISTGPMDNGKIFVYLKIDIHKLDKEVAGEVSAALKDIVDIKLRKTQEELDLHSHNN